MPVRQEEDYIISQTHIVFICCAEVPSKLCEIFLLGVLKNNYSEI